MRHAGGTRLTDRPIAVVTGADHPTGLGSGRALKRAGAVVWGVTDTPAAEPCRSRVWDALHLLPSDVADGWVKELAELGDNLPRRAFLLPTQDRLVQAVSRRRNELEAFFAFVLPDDHIVQTFLDKTRFYEWARGLGLPLPQTHIVRNVDELAAALREMPYPVILKPLYRTESWDRVSPVQKAYRLESAEDFGSIGFDPLATVPSLVLSQWIEGPDSCVHYCLAYCRTPGRMTAAYTGRKLLQYPRQTGSTAICVGTDNGEVRELAQEVFQKAEFQGLGSLEVKYGPDDRPYITEPTVGRPNLQSYSATAAGCNLHAIAMADALGLDWDLTSVPRKNCWWIEENAVLELVTTDHRDPVPWTLLGRELLRARRAAAAYWAWWDPEPAASLAMRKVRRGLRRLLRRRA